MGKFMKIMLPQFQTGDKSPDGVCAPQITPGINRLRYRIMAGFITSSSPVPLKTRRVGQPCTLNLWRLETSSRWCDVVAAQVSSTSLDHGSKLRDLSTKALV
ncbi:hypothetical protein TNCV_1238871 [Trichonephila clavipes]|nr:hypothetical protein TNCV_1238871 [Trichonephila clavipes]